MNTELKEVRDARTAGLLCPSQLADTTSDSVCCRLRVGVNQDGPYRRDCIGAKDDSDGRDRRARQLHESGDNAV